MKVLILCGGRGVRLFPVSREDLPKQFLKIGMDLSLFQKTLLRALKLVSLEDVLIITGRKYENLIREEVSELFKEKGINPDVIFEPSGRNTFPAVLLGVLYLLTEKGAGEKEVVFLMPSDHWIEPEDGLSKYVKLAREAASEGFIVTFGIKPRYPATEYGYIKIGRLLRERLFEVETFVEKPDRKKAEEYLKEGSFYWNSGMFVFAIKTFLEELEKLLPDVFAMVDGKGFEEIISMFDRLPSTSIDYAIMERTDRAVVIPLDLRWSDVGSWESVYDLLEKDQDGNVKVGRVKGEETLNSLIWGTEKSVIAIGVEDLIIVEGRDAILVAKRGRSSCVKKVLS